MAVCIGVVSEIADGEKRVALVPEVAKKFAALGAALRMERLAGLASHYTDQDYVGVELQSDADTVIAGAGLYFCVRPPTPERLDKLASGTVLAGLLQPYESRERLVGLPTHQDVKRQVSGRTQDEAGVHDRLTG